MPIALGRVAGETVKEMVQLFSLENPTQVETEEEVEGENIKYRSVTIMSE